MLFKYAQTCIKTNGFVSKYFNISRSCRQGCPIAPLVYILQAEPVACAIRGDSEIQGIKLPGSKVNYEKTKGMYIGSAKNNRPKFTKIVWTKDNVKTLGIHHGYNIQNDEIWKSIIDKMKNCVHVWKSRNLTYTGKTLIVKNLLISLCGYEN